MSIVNNLDNNCFENILNFLSFEDLARVCSVCKQWLHCGNEYIQKLSLQEHFPALERLDQQVWEKYVDLHALELSFEEAPSVSRRVLFFALSRIFQTVKMEGRARIFLLDLPKNLTLNKAVAFAESPLQGKPVDVVVNWLDVTRQFGEIRLEKTRQLLITDSALDGSRTMNLKQQQDLVRNLGGEVAEVVSAVAFSILSELRFSEDPDSAPSTGYFRCLEQINGVSVGVGIQGDGRVYIDDAADGDGVGAVWKVQG